MNTRLSKTITILAIVSLLSAGSAFAQKQNNGDRDWQKGPPTVEEKLARISAALGLDDAQSVAMLVVLQEQEQTRIRLHEETMALMGPEICADRAATESAILEILTAEQAELFLQMKEERKGKANDRRSGNRGGGLDCSD